MNIVETTITWVKEKMKNDTTGHDWYHIERVMRQAKYIAKREGANEKVVTLAALLHDVADDKLVDDEAAALAEIRQFLQDKQLAATEVEHIMTIITTISFRGGQGKVLQSLEAQVVQDADRLDAIGAIGIARTFQFSGAKGQAMYDPTIPLQIIDEPITQRYGATSAIHHFYEKLLRLKDLFQTETGKQLAEERHAFLETFLQQFFEEWDESE